MKSITLASLVMMLTTTTASGQYPCVITYVPCTTDTECEQLNGGPLDLEPANPHCQYIAVPPGYCLAEDTSVVPCDYWSN